MPSITPESLSAIPANISCASFNAILTGFDQSLASLPPQLTPSLQTSRDLLLKRPPQGCPVSPPVGQCKDTPVDEESLCAQVDSRAVEEYLTSGNASGDPCSFPVVAYACSSLQDVTAAALADILECQLASNTSSPVAVWKLLFNKTSAVLEDALNAYSQKANISVSTSSATTALDAIGEVRMQNFSSAQLNDVHTVNTWFQTLLRPFEASMSDDFLSCLSTLNFSCDAYQAVINDLSQQWSSMDSVHQEAVYTQFIQVFLSRNDSSDFACVSNTNGSRDWLQKNFGVFSTFATLTELLKLNVNFSSFDSLALLTPTQMAQLVLTSGALNNTEEIQAVFVILETADALQNVDQFLTLLTTDSVVPDIEPAVRDVMMNLTFLTIRDHLSEFTPENWTDWFTVTLIPILPSLSPEMLTVILGQVNCHSYRTIVKGMDMVYGKMPQQRIEEITTVLLAHLKGFLAMFSSPACLEDIKSNADWLAANLGQFSEVATYSELKELNITGVDILGSLTPDQKAQLILDPGSGALENATLVAIVFQSLTESANVSQLDVFFNALVNATLQANLTFIANAAVRDVMLNLTLTALAPTIDTFQTVDYVAWFQIYLVVLMPSITPESLSAIPANISCASYQAILKGFSSASQVFSVDQFKMISSFCVNFLHSKESSCTFPAESDGDWLTQNFGPFEIYLSYSDILLLNHNFTGFGALHLLTPVQIAQLCATPGKMSSPEDVSQVMMIIPTSFFGTFFDTVSPVILENEDSYNSDVKSAFLQAVFNEANLSSSSTSDIEVDLWLTYRLMPLLSSVTVNQVKTLFDIVQYRSCNTSQELVTALHIYLSSFTNDTKSEIYKNILQSLTAPPALHCYTNGSFYLFLTTTFQYFGFPNLTTFLSLIPQQRQSELINSMSPSELGSLISQSSVINTADLCTILQLYNNINDFLTLVNLPEYVKPQVLTCIWPIALSCKTSAEADVWFNQNLMPYFNFLTKDLINMTAVLKAQCFTFQKLIYVLGMNFNFTNANLLQQDVYNMIRGYLSTGPNPRCYDPNNPNLNSTAWFVNYFGVFIKFLSLTDLNTFVSTTQLQVFVQNSQNMQLFNNTAIDENVLSYYTMQLYTVNTTVNPMQLPGPLLCQAPPSAFVALTQNDSINIMSSLGQFCNGSNPGAYAALAGNIKTINEGTIQNLGQGVTGLTVGQIITVSPNVIVSSVPLLAVAKGWDLGQAIAIVQIITSEGYQINNSKSLQALGSLISGVPSSVFGSIPTSVLISASQNATFVNDLLSTPAIVQQTVVNKIITASQDVTAIMENVPNQLASAIPRPLLAFPNGTLPLQYIVQKAWSYEQASVFFGKISAAVEDTNTLPGSVLQGFTCTGVNHLPGSKIINLISACRPRPNQAKIAFQETQLICMNSYIRNQSVQNFTNYPPELLLYFDYNQVQQVNCQSYFTAVGTANFGVLSPELNKQASLFSNAAACLGISGTNLTLEQVQVLGNMCCTLDRSYIENSDPLILEQLKNCNSFTPDQVTAIENLLLSGNTQYGPPSTWNIQTLQNLVPLPLFLSYNFWSSAQFTTMVKATFLRSFLPQLRQQGTSQSNLIGLFKQISYVRSKRSADCTAGNITQATIGDPAFPFGYDLTQFTACLDSSTVTANLAQLVLKVVDPGYQRVILDNLNQAYPSGLSDQLVQQLGQISRVATLNDINKWNITKIDTLAALMLSSNGAWSTVNSAAIINKYLATPGNELGSIELNSIGGPNLCSLNMSVLSAINESSIRDANTLDLTSCSSSQKIVLYNIANVSFSSERNDSAVYYTLISSYLGGAPLNDILKLAAQNISMDVPIFKSLLEDVRMNLNVTQVKELMGANLYSLKTFENDSVVHEWLASQLQSDLDTLGLNLNEGKVGHITIASTGANTTTTQPGITSNTPGTTNNTSGTTNNSPGSENSLSGTSGTTNNPSGVTNNPSGVTNNPSGVTNNPSGATNNPSGATNNPSGATNNPSVTSGSNQTSTIHTSHPTAAVTNGVHGAVNGLITVITALIARHLLL